MSFINKESDKDLNEFLLSSINEVRARSASDWEEQKAEMNDHHKKLHKLY